MLRFLLLCITVFLMYVGFTYVSTYDTNVQFALANYTIETTLFTFVVITLVLLLLLLTGLKFIFLLFDLPQIIKNKMHRNKLQRLNSKALKSVADLLMGNKVSALDLAGRVVVENGEDNTDILHLIKAEKNEAFEEKVRYLRMLTDKKHFSTYATKKLAELFYNSSHYAEAEEYAVMAFNKDDTDTAVMLLLIRIYAKMSVWHKMIFIVSKIQRADSSLLESISGEVARYYFLAAKHYLAAEDDAEAAKYLESSLSLKVDYIEALTLYSEIKMNMKHTAEVLKVLRAAYSYCPTFEIAELFIRCSMSSPEVIYNNLTSIADPKDNNGLYLAIAAYLGLTDKINQLKNSDPLTQDTGN